MYMKNEKKKINVFQILSYEFKILSMSKHEQTENSYDDYVI